MINWIAKLTTVKRTFILLCTMTVVGLALLSCNRQKSAESTESTDAGGEQVQPNTLTAQQKEEGWQLLFDGRTLDGWKRFNRDTIGPLWSVRGGAILCDGEGLGEGSGAMGGSLVTTRQFSNFDLIADFKLSVGGNSGILYHVVEDPKYRYDYETGPEYQVLDDGGWAGDELKDSQKAASSYDLYPASPSKKLNPAGEWNTARIVYNNGHVEHWLNGEKVLEYDESSEDFANRKNNSKWVDYPDWHKSKSGAISLQDHGAPVYYRNIRIREL